MHVHESAGASARASAMPEVAAPTPVQHPQPAAEPEIMAAALEPGAAIPPSPPQMDASDAYPEDFRTVGDAPGPLEANASADPSRAAKTAQQCPNGSDLHSGEVPSANAAAAASGAADGPAEENGLSPAAAGAVAKAAARSLAGVHGMPGAADVQLTDGISSHPSGMPAIGAAPNGVPSGTPVGMRLDADTIPDSLMAGTRPLASSRMQADTPLDNRLSDPQARDRKQPQSQLPARQAAALEAALQSARSKSHISHAAADSQDELIGDNITPNAAAYPNVHQAKLGAADRNRHGNVHAGPDPDIANEAADARQQDLRQGYSPSSQAQLNLGNENLPGAANVGAGMTHPAMHPHGDVSYCPSGDQGTSMDFNAAAPLIGQICQAAGSSQPSGDDAVGCMHPASDPLAAAGVSPASVGLHASQPANGDAVHVPMRPASVAAGASPASGGRPTESSAGPSTNDGPSTNEMRHVTLPAAKLPETIALETELLVRSQTQLQMTQAVPM